MHKVEAPDSDIHIQQRFKLNYTKSKSRWHVEFYHKIFH